MPDAVIIEVAVNGSTTKATNPTVPCAPEEIAEQALACIRAGAAIVHSHPRPGRPVDQLAEYQEAWAPVLAAHPEALLYPTARIGAPEETVVETWSHNLALREQGLAAMSLVDPGSVNLGMRPDGTVEPAFLGTVYVNSHHDTLYKLERSAATGLWPSVSIFDPSFLRSVVGFAAAGRLAPGLMIKLFFGQDAMFGLRPTETALDAYLELLHGTGFPWSAAVLGGDVFADGFADLVLARGGHLRVGLEDLNGPGTTTNVELVQRASELVRDSGRDVATMAVTRQLLAHQAG